MLNMLRDYRRKRIAKVIDWIKQPWQDAVRHLNAVIAARFNGARIIKQERPFVRRVLLIRRNRLGDAICLLPWVASAKKQHGIIIDVLGSTSNIEILRRSGLFEHVDELPETFLGNKWLIRWHPTFRLLRKRPRYDLVFNASASYSSFACFVMWLLPTNRRLGVISNQGSLWDRTLTHGIVQRDISDDMHQTEKINSMAGLVGLKCAELPFVRLDTNQGARHKILLCPMVNRKASEWPAQHWLAVSSGLQDAGLTPRWIGISHDPATPAVQTSLGQFIDELSTASVIVCSEGGASHLACLYGASAIVLSGKNIAGTWAPWSDQYVLLEQEKSVEQIRPEQVLEAVFSQLARPLKSTRAA